LLQCAGTQPIWLLHSAGTQPIWLLKCAGTQPISLLAHEICLSQERLPVARQHIAQYEHGGTAATVAECYTPCWCVCLSQHHNKIYRDTQSGQNLQVSLFRPHSYSVPLPIDVFHLFYGLPFSPLPILSFRL
jgi:hypothetical protein